MAQKEFNHKKKVSIVLPNYNSYKYIDATIKSIIFQTYKNWELIIVDDCSDDKTKTKLLKYKNNLRIKIYWLKKNKGAAYCRNFAISKSKSDYLAFIDSDDIWEREKIKLQLNFMKKNNYNFTYTYYKTFDQKTKKVNPQTKYDFNSFTKDTSIATSTMMIKKKITKGVKFTNTKICEDYYFKCQILKKISYAHCLTNYLSKYRLRKDSLQSNKLKNFYWIWKINHKYNKFSFIKNMISLFFISLSSIKKYGLK